MVSNVEIFPHKIFVISAVFCYT